MNRAILIGNLARDPELRNTQGGLPVCNFTIAVNRKFANAQGVREADFINVVAWRQTAEFVSRYFTKGRRIAVIGSIQTRTYDAPDGTRKYFTEVVADEVEFADSRPQGEGGYPSQQSAPRREMADMDYPMPPEPQGQGQGFTQIEDDDLPF